MSTNVEVGFGAPRLHFGEFVLDVQRAELSRAGQPVALRPKAWTLLNFLVAHAGQAVSKEELISAVWPGVVVGDDSLTQCVGELRAALGDRGGQAIIRTLPRLGYRFEMPVQALADAAPVAPAAPPEDGVGSATPPNARRLQRVGWVPLAALLAVGLLIAALFVARSGVARSSLDEAITARHVIAVMPLATAADDAALRETAARISDEIAAQIATRLGTRSIGRARTAGFDAAAPQLERLANDLHASYAVTGRVAHVAGGPGAAVDVQVLTVPTGVTIGAAHFEIDTSSAAPNAAEIGQLVANLVRAKGGEAELRRATAPGHVPDAVDMTTIGWDQITRLSSPDDPLRAREYFRKALAQDRESLVALLGLAASYVQSKSLSQGFSPEDSAEFSWAMERMLREAPNDASTLHLWADMQLMDGRPELAIPALEKANRLTPQYVNGHDALGRALFRVGRADEAVVELERAVRLAMLGNEARRGSRAYAALAEIAIGQGEYARAAEFARQAIAVRPNTYGAANAYAVLAAAEALLGRSEEAAAAMKIARVRSPRTTVANYDALRPSSHAEFQALRAPLFQGLRMAGLPQQ